jgi:hypothetical protein
LPGVWTDLKQSCIRDPNGTDELVFVFGIGFILAVLFWIAQKSSPCSLRM